ncbi:hypothetical protein D9M68_426260 [compost metagenome]
MGVGSGMKSPLKMKRSGPSPSPGSACTRISPKVSQISLSVVRRVATWPDSVLP